jgi:hypothetical protein
LQQGATCQIANIVVRILREANGYKYSSKNTDKEKKKWSSHQCYYHLGCFQSLNKKEQQQLFSIVNVNSDIDESEKDSLENSLKETWGDNN